MHKLRFPYGHADFYTLITEGDYYVDRTDYIRLLEEKGRTLLFLRPRRFGKSLLLSMLENYDDVNKADEFTRLFGHLAIGQNPTPRHNQYLILYWDFSTVNPRGTSDAIQQSLYDSINGSIETFKVHYDKMLHHPIEFHLPQTVLGMDIAQGGEKVVIGVGVDVGDTPPITQHLHRMT
jgi:hypothetical protein